MSVGMSLFITTLKTPCHQREWRNCTTANVQAEVPNQFQTLTGRKDDLEKGGWSRGGEGIHPYGLRKGRTQNTFSAGYKLGTNDAQIMSLRSLIRTCFLQDARHMT